MTTSNGQQQALALERLGGQCLGISQQRGSSKRFKATLKTQQRLAEIRTSRDQVMADPSRKGMRGIHHPMERPGLVQCCRNSANALQGSDQDPLEWQSRVGLRCTCGHHAHAYTPIAAVELLHQARPLTGSSQQQHTTLVIRGALHQDVRRHQLKP
jgi:hypothetical protein